MHAFLSVKDVPGSSMCCKIDHRDLVVFTDNNVHGFEVEQSQCPRIDDVSSISKHLSENQQQSICAHQGLSKHTRGLLCGSAPNKKSRS